MNLDYNQLVAAGNDVRNPDPQGPRQSSSWAGRSPRSCRSAPRSSSTARSSTTSSRRRSPAARRADVALEAGVGRFVYWLIMLFVLMAVFQTLGLTVVTEPINAFLTKIVALPAPGPGGGGPRGHRLGGGERPAGGGGQPPRRLPDRPEARGPGRRRDEEGVAGLHPRRRRLLPDLAALPPPDHRRPPDGGPEPGEGDGRPDPRLPAEPVRGADHLLPVLRGGPDRPAPGHQPARGDRLRPSASTSCPSGSASAPPAVAPGPRRPSPDTSSSPSCSSWAGCRPSRPSAWRRSRALAEQLLAGLFNIVVAVVIFGVGLFLSRVAYRAISPSGEGPSSFLANVARAAILIFTGAMALFRAGLASEIVDPGLRRGHRGSRPRRRPRLRPGRTGGGRQDRQRLEVAGSVQLGPPDPATLNARVPFRPARRKAGGAFPAPRTPPGPVSPPPAPNLSPAPRPRILCVGGS